MDIAMFQEIARRTRERMLNAEPMPMEDEVASGVYLLDWSQPPGNYVGREVFYRRKKFTITRIGDSCCIGVTKDGMDQRELPVTSSDFDLAYQVRGQR
jgi:hypothetical protein